MSASAAVTEANSLPKDPITAGTSSAGDNAKPVGEAASSSKSTESTRLQQAHELLESFCKKHLDVTDGGSTSASSNATRKQTADLARLKDQLWELFSAEKTDITYLESPAFRNKIRLIDQGCVKQPSKKKYHLKELIDNMIINPPKTEEQRKQVEINRSRKVAKSSEKLLEKLGEKLNEIIEKINKVEQQDGFEEDEDEEGGAAMECNYVYVSRLKQRAIVIYNKIQELECNPVTTMRENQRPIIVRCSTCPEVNRAAGKMATRCFRKELTPDFTDVVAIVRRVNDKENLGMSDERQRSVAQQVFREIVEEIKKRRIRETRLNMESLEIEFGEQDEYDPAEKDPELEARLKQSEAEGREKITAVINEFADRQTSGVDESGDAVSDRISVKSTQETESNNSKRNDIGNESNHGASSIPAIEASLGNKSSDGNGQGGSNVKVKDDNEVDDDDDPESELDESYLNSDESDDETERNGTRKSITVVKDGVGASNAESGEDDLHDEQMALEDVEERMGSESAVTNNSQEDNGQEVKEGTVADADKDILEDEPNSSAEPADNESSPSGSGKDDSNNASDVSNDDRDNCDIRQSKETEKEKSSQQPEVHEVSEDEAEVVPEAGTRGSSIAEEESMEMIFVESVDDDGDSDSIRPKSNGKHLQATKENRAGPKSRKRPSKNIFETEELPAKKMAIIELSDDSEDAARSDEPETIVSDANAAPYSANIAGRLRALGTNVVPVGEPVPHRSPEVIEIDSD